MTNAAANQTKNIVIIGATSAIAQATIREYAKQKHRLFLVARNKEQLNLISDDAKLRGAHEVDKFYLDTTDYGAHSELMNCINETLPSIDIVLIAHGTLPDQTACQNNVALMMQEVEINALSTIALLSHFANQMETQQTGDIAVISSVAGERGRQSNYIYGAAKSMVSTFLQGLRNRLYSKNINVLDIKPGFVDTPMTASFKKGLLWAQPEQVAKSIVKAIDKRKSTLYTPWFWRLIMLIIRNIPETIFKRLKL